MEGNYHVQQKQLLDFAFDEAINACHLNGLPEELVEEVLTTAMNAYATREGIPFTAEEVHATIVAGMETLKNKTSNFSLYADKTIL